MLPPGRVLRVQFDAIIQRFDSDLPNTYKVVVSYNGPPGTKADYRDEYALDLNIYRGSTPPADGIPEVAKAVKDLKDVEVLDLQHQRCSRVQRGRRCRRESNPRGDGCTTCKSCWRSYRPRRGQNSTHAYTQEAFPPDRSRSGITVTARNESGPGAACTQARPQEVGLTDRDLQARGVVQCRMLANGKASCSVENSRSICVSSPFASAWVR